jgi:hypothetical protein
VAKTQYITKDLFDYHAVPVEAKGYAPETLRPTDDINTAGVKFDNGKTRDDLIPPEVEEAIAKVLEFGAKKYAERNWEKGMLWSRPYAATRRHMRNWFARRDFGKGPGNDKDSGFSDLWHAATNIAFLIAYELRGSGTDDRPVQHVVAGAATSRVG